MGTIISKLASKLRYIFEISKTFLFFILYFAIC